MPPRCARCWRNISITFGSEPREQRARYCSIEKMGKCCPSRLRHRHRTHRSCRWTRIHQVQVPGAVIYQYYWVGAGCVSIQNAGCPRYIHCCFGEANREPCPLVRRRALLIGLHFPIASLSYYFLYNALTLTWLRSSLWMYNIYIYMRAGRPGGSSG